MRQLIRKNTFETNSSSMHSLVITKSARPYTNDAKHLYYYGDDFELFGCCDTQIFERHPFEVLSEPKDKLRYYVAHYVGFKHQTEKLKEVEELVHELTGCPKNKIKLYYEDIESWRSDKVVKSYGWAGVNDTGEDVFDYIEKNNITLEEFVTDPRYTVIVDGDEYQEFKKMFLKGFIDLDNIEYISSGKDFWLDNVKHLSLYYINSLNDEKYAELMSDIEDYTCDWVEKIEIVDEDYDEPVGVNQLALPYLRSFLEVIRTAKPNKYIELVLKSHTEDDFKQILGYVDEIIQTTY